MGTYPESFVDILHCLIKISILFNIVCVSKTKINNNKNEKDVKQDCFMFRTHYGRNLRVAVIRRHERVNENARLLIRRFVFKATMEQTAGRFAAVVYWRKGNIQTVG